MKNLLLERICFRLSKEVTDLRTVNLHPEEVDKIEDSFYEILEEEFENDNYICGKQNIRPTQTLEEEV